MSERAPVPLTPVLIKLGSDEICNWPFADGFVGRLLRFDIPQRAVLSDCRIWTYRNLENQIVGFGTIDVCHDWSEYTGGKRHPYIPLLAKNPTLSNPGAGTSIVAHLIGEAALLACRRPDKVHGVVFLDVYTDNERITDVPRADPQENGKPYIVMARRVSVAST
jgi:hypothetical protein